MYNIKNHDLENDPRGPLYMPIFAMFTVHTGATFREFLRSNGVKYMIQKPPNKDEIFEIIRDAIAEVRF